MDDKQAVKAAKDRLYGLRKTPEARAEADAVQSRHGSRKSGMAQTGVRRANNAGSSAKAKAQATSPSQQTDLFADLDEAPGDHAAGLA